MQIPMVMLFLSRSGLVDPATFAKQLAGTEVKEQNGGEWSYQVVAEETVDGIHPVRFGRFALPFRSLDLGRCFSFVRLRCCRVLFSYDGFRSGL